MNKAISFLKGAVLAYAGYTLVSFLVWKFTPFGNKLGQLQSGNWQGLTGGTYE